MQFDFVRSIQESNRTLAASARETSQATTQAAANTLQVSSQRMAELLKQTGGDLQRAARMAADELLRAQQVVASAAATPTAGSVQLGPGTASAAGRQAILAAQSRMQIAGRESDAAKFAAQLAQLDPFLQNTEKLTRRAGHGFGRLGQEMTTAVRVMLGMNPVVAQIGNALGQFAIGSAPMIAILGGVAAFTYAWQLWTKDAREAKQLMDEIHQAQLQLTGSARTTEVALLRQREAALTAQLGGLQAMRGTVGTGLAGTAADLANLHESNRVAKELEDTRKQLATLAGTEAHATRETATADLDRVRNARQSLDVARLQGVAQERARVNATADNALEEARRTLAGQQLTDRENTVNAERRFGQAVITANRALAERARLAGIAREQMQLQGNVDLLRDELELMGRNNQELERRRHQLEATVQMTRELEEFQKREGRTPTTAEADALQTSVNRTRDLKDEASAVGEQLVSWKEKIEPFLRAIEGVRGAITDAIAGSLTSGLRSVEKFGEQVRNVFARMIAEIVSNKIMQVILSRAGANLSISAQQIAAANMMATAAGLQVQAARDMLRAAGVQAGGGAGQPPINTTAQAPSALLRALLGAGAGFGVGYGIGGAVGSRTAGGISGALGGAAAGFALGGPIGALAGGLTGLVGGMLGGARAAREYRQQLEELRRSYVQSILDIREQLGDITHGQADIERTRAQFKALREQLAKLYPELPPYVTGSGADAMRAERKKKFDELDELERRRIEQLGKEANALDDMTEAAERFRSVPSWFKVNLAAWRAAHESPMSSPVPSNPNFPSGGGGPPRAKLTAGDSPVQIGQIVIHTRATNGKELLADLMAEMKRQGLATFGAGEEQRILSTF